MKKLARVLALSMCASSMAQAQAVFQSLQIQGGPNDALPAIQIMNPGAKLCFAGTTDCIQDSGGSLSIGSLALTGSATSSAGNGGQRLAVEHH